MFLFNIQTKNGEIVHFERDVTDNKISVDKISFIKAIRNSAYCSLTEAKNFCELVISELNKMSASPDLVRVRIREELDKIHNSNELLDILRFVRTVQDYPMPDNGRIDANGVYHSPLGSFTESGEYKPF